MRLNAQIIPPALSVAALADGADLAVRYQDADLVVVDKPPGLACHRSKLIGADPDYLVDRVRAQLGVPLYLVHRLDRATSGLVVLATSREIAGQLGRAFMARAVRKTYLGVCRGWPAAEGAIAYPLSAGPNQAPKPALTRWRRLAIAELPVAMGRYPVQRYALLAINPESGRHQQIRRHFHHLSHPLIGDTTHGRGDHNRLFRSVFGSHRLLLHAWRLEFRHPRHDLMLALEAPPSAAFARVLAYFGWELAPMAPRPDPASGFIP